MEPFRSLEWRFVYDNGKPIPCADEAEARSMAAAAKGHVECRTPWCQPWQLQNGLRSLVGRWLRLRGEHVIDSFGLSSWLMARGQQAAVFQQLAADADHSDLLSRLALGAEPLPFEEWQRTHAR